MAANVSLFHPQNIVDTCAVWNVLSSQRLFAAARGAGVAFICTRVVLYECLYKTRKRTSDADRELRGRLEAARRTAAFAVFPLDIDDLQVVEVLENRKRLGKGELSSIAFALRTRQVVLTDDQKARKLALDVLPVPGAQTTPHLLGWLFFNSHLSDSDKDEIIREHKRLGRPLSQFFEDMYLEACRCRLMASQGMNRNE